MQRKLPFIIGITMGSENEWKKVKMTP